MSRNSYTIANVALAAVRAAINSAIDTLRSCGSGSGRTSSPVQGQLNWDSTKKLMEVCRDDSGNWVALGFPHGQCRFDYVDANTCKLSRYNGRHIVIDGGIYEIPSSGVTLSSSGLSVSTLLYVYAYMNSGTMTLEAVTTAPILDSNTGITVKNGDTSRTLVGMVYLDAGPIFIQSTSAKQVSSFFNRRRSVALNWTTADRALTSITPTYQEAESGSRIKILSWGIADVDFGVCGSCWNAANTYIGIPGIGVDTFTSNGTLFETRNKNTTQVPMGGNGAVGLAAGLHTLSLIGCVSATGTFTIGAYTRLFAIAEY